MNENIEQAKEQVISYYKEFIEKCISVHGVDLHAIISDCVTAGYNHAQNCSAIVERESKFRCTLCHSIDIKMKMWDNPNNQGQYFEPSADEDDMKNCWCNRCETHVALESVDGKVIEPEPQYVYKCSECNSEDVEIKQWVQPNRNNEIGGNDCPDREDCWCNECEEHHRLDLVEAENPQSKAE